MTLKPNVDSGAHHKSGHIVITAAQGLMQHADYSGWRQHTASNC